MLCQRLCLIGQRYTLNKEYKGSLTCEELGTVLFVIVTSGGWRVAPLAKP